jgi:hypothetical protein
MITRILKSAIVVMSLVAGVGATTSSLTITAITNPVSSHNLGIVRNGATRPTLQPLITPSPPASTTSTGSVVMENHGAHIQLKLGTAPIKTGLKAVVQWGTPTGRWYDVDGWRSETATPFIEWWVSPSDYGKGPFRWVIYSDHSDTPISTSQLFNLPHFDGDITDIVLN